MGIKLKATDAANGTKGVADIPAPAQGTATDGKVDISAPAPSAPSAPSTSTQKAAVMTKEEEEFLASKSATVELVRCVVDPTDKDAKSTKENGKVVKVDGYKIVGYEFKFLEDTQVPDIMPSSNMKKNPMEPAQDADIAKTVLVKAGETKVLTKLENAMLISRPEYNGSFTAGKYPVQAKYTKPSATAGAVAIPAVHLQAIANLEGTSTGFSSIRDVPTVDCLKFTRTKNANGSNSIDRQPLPGFEKFAPLSVKKGSTIGAVSVDKSTSKVRNEAAATFLDIVNSRKSR